MESPEAMNDLPEVAEDGPAIFRYRVESRSNEGQWYLVDLTARDGHGWCPCIHCSTKCVPNLNRLGYRVPYAKGRKDATECRHIAAALAYLHEQVTMPMLAKFRNGV